MQTMLLGARADRQNGRGARGKTLADRVPGETGNLMLRRFEIHVRSPGSAEN